MARNGAWRTVTWWDGAQFSLPFLLLAIEVASLAPWSHLAGLLLVSRAAVPPVSARDGLPPLIPDPILVATSVVAWVTRRLAPRRRTIHDTHQWGRWVVSIGSGVAVAGGAVLSLHLYDASDPLPLTPGWFGAFTAGHEAGALLCAIAFLGLVWWRGASVGSGSPGDRHAGTRAVVGGAAIAVSSAIATGVMPSLLGSVIPISTIIVIPSMIGALVLTSLEESQLPRLGGPVATAPNRSWLGMVIALCICVGVLGAGIALILGGRASAVIALLRAVGGVIGGLFVLLASIAIIPVLLFADWLAGLMQGRGEPPPDVPLSGLGKQSFLERFDTAESPAVIDPAITETALAIAALVVVGVVVWRLMRPASPNDLDGAESEERSSVFSWANLLGRRAGGKVPGEHRDDLNSVRRAYRAFLLALEQKGLPRAPSETPDQFARRVVSDGTGAVIDPGGRADLGILTRAYEAVRYGTASPERLGQAASQAARRLAAVIDRPHGNGS